MAESQPGLTVAVTGPTGDIGRALLAALERSDRVARVVGMARRPFDPAERGWRKVRYRQGDVLDPVSCAELARDADVLVHLAFVIFGADREQTREVNLRGSENVFRAAAAAGVDRLVYTSSVAAYGFDPATPRRVREDLPPRGTASFYYSAQKAELEQRLREVLAGSDVRAYVFRPSIVAGPDALTLVESVARLQVGGRLPGARELMRALPFALPFARPVLPDPGLPLQLVHHDDVAAALLAAVEGRGAGGVYNLAAPGEITVRDLAGELGWYALPVPELAVRAAAALVERLGPLLPQDLAWIQAARAPVIMDTAKARRELGWWPRHTAHEILRETVRAGRRAGLV